MESRTPPDHRELVKEAFMRCFSAESEVARDRLLAQLESECPEVAVEVRSLLKTSLNAGDAVEQVFGFVENSSLTETSEIGPPRVELSKRSAMTDGITVAGTVIGPYKLLEQIGEGGMGSVFMAQQSSPIKRRVALKIIKPGMDSRQVVARFEAERQALAMMDHSNIAKVLDAGTTESGLPYFVMELVKGIPITEYCDLEKLVIKDRLKLFIDLCRGVQHAHQKGIIHRDLKPSNVLVTLHDGKPVVKIIDFGIAKAMNQDLTDRTLFTQFAQMIGTPLYMSPEQAALSGIDVDTRSDVYSLGVLLYELLTGSTPFDKALLRGVGIDEIRRMIRETEPPRPSQRVGQKTTTLKAANDSTLRSKPTPNEVRAQRELKGELDWIVMKALEKDRNRRYESPNAFAADVDRVLDGEPVLACPPTLVYRLRSYARRNRRLLTATSLIALTALIGSAFSLWYANQAAVATRNALSAKTEAELQAKRAGEHATASAVAARESDLAKQRAETAKQTAIQERLKAEHILYTSDLRLAASHVSHQLHSDAFQTLLRQSPRDTQVDHRSWEWYYLLNQADRNDLSWLGHNSEIVCVDWNVDKRRVATASHDGFVRIWDSSNGQMLREWSLGKTILTAMKWSPDGKLLAWGSAADEGLLRVWDEASDTVAERRSNGNSIWSLAWNHDSTRIATGSAKKWSSNPAEDDDYNFVVWTKGKHSWEVEDRQLMTNHVASVEWNSTGDWIAATTEKSSLKIFDSNGLQLKYEVNDSSIYRSAWSTKKELLVYSTMLGDCVLYDVDRQAELKRFQAHVGLFEGLSWSPDGKWLATGGHDGMVHIWETKNWTLYDSRNQHQGPVRDLCWDQDSERIVSVGADQFVNILSLQSKAVHLDIPENVVMDSGHFYWTQGRRLKAITIDPNIVEIDPVSGVTLETRSLPVPGQWSLLSRDLALRQTDHVEVLSLSRGGEILKWGLNPKKVIFCAAQDGSKLFSFNTHIMTNDGFIFDLETGRENRLEFERMYPQHQIAFSPNGTFVACAGKGNVTGDGLSAHAGWLHLINLSDAQNSKVVRVGNSVSRTVSKSVGWSADSSRVAVGKADGVCEVFDSTSLKKLASNHFHRGSVDTISLHPDGKRIASGGEDRTVKIWDASSGEILLSLSMEEKVKQLEWSLDGVMLAAKDGSNRIRVWDANGGYQFAESKSYGDRMRKRYETAMVAAIEIEDWSAAKLASIIMSGRTPLKNARDSYLTALLCVADQDLVSYRKTCDAVVQDFPEVNQPTECFFAGWTLCIAPGAVTDYSIVIGKIKAAFREHPSDADLGFVLGALLVRAGRFNEATPYLQKSTNLNEAGSRLASGYRDLIRALNCHNLGDANGASAHQKSAELSAEQDTVSQAWNRKLLARLLREEVIELCGQTGR